MKFQVIPPSQLSVMWPHVAPLLDKAVSLSPGKIVLKDVLDAAIAGAYLVWVAVDDDKGEFVGAVTTRIVYYPQGNALAMDFLGGTRMKEWLHLAQEAVEDHAKRNNCKYLEAYGRRAWQRYLEPHGWGQAYITFQKELEDE